MNLDVVELFEKHIGKPSIDPDSDYHSDYHPNYYVENREHLLQKQIAYNALHSDELAEKKQEKLPCRAGKDVRSGDFKRDMLTHFKHSPSCVEIFRELAAQNKLKGCRELGLLPAYEQMEKDDQKKKGLNPDACRLNKRSSMVLRQWFEDNKDWPYPNSDVLQELSATSGASLMQVKNFFMNTRRSFRKRCREVRLSALPPYASVSCLNLCLVPEQGRGASTKTRPRRS